MTRKEEPLKSFLSEKDSDPFSKYKEHEREKRRERRIKNIERERENKY